MQFYTKPYLFSENRIISVNVEELLFPTVEFIRDLVNTMLDKTFEIIECDISVLEIVNEDLVPLIPVSSQTTNLAMGENIVVLEDISNNYGAYYIENEAINFEAAQEVSEEPQEAPENNVSGKFSRSITR